MSGLEPSENAAAVVSSTRKFRRGFISEMKSPVRVYDRAVAAVTGEPSAACSAGGASA